jgi:Transposase DDE domain
MSPGESMWPFPPRGTTRPWPVKPKRNCPPGCMSGPPGDPQGPRPCTRSWRTTVIYAVTSLAHAQASSARLADYLRGHWAIENGLHYIRDVTFGEDASQVRTGTGQHVMTCLRNLVIGTLSRAGPVNLAAALRFHSRNPHRPLAALGIG